MNRTYAELKSMSQSCVYEPGYIKLCLNSTLPLSVTVPAPGDEDHCWTIRLCDSRFKLSLLLSIVTKTARPLMQFSAILSAILWQKTST